MRNQAVFVRTDFNTGVKFKVLFYKPSPTGNLPGLPFSKRLDIVSTRRDDRRFMADVLNAMLSPALTIF